MVSRRVSRLYNTLEKIRTGKPGEFSVKKITSVNGIDRGSGARKKRRIILLWTTAMLGLALVIFFAGPLRKATMPPITTPAGTPANTPAQPAAEPAPRADNTPRLPLMPSVSLNATGADLYRQLNDTGLALIQENQHWQGIYYLERAHKQQPEKPEALINMAVALAELGLRAPAKRLFSEAYALAPNHPLLRKNLEILGQAEFFDPQWLPSLTAGQAQPGQTTQPK